MSQQLINHSPDLKQLRDEGFEVQTHGGYLLIHHVPYINDKKQVKLGTLVSVLDLVNSNRTAVPSNHVIHFIGEYPCDNTGSPIKQLFNESRTYQVSPGLTINHTFSNRPPNGYTDYYHKITQYVSILSAPAASIDKNVTAKTFAPVADTENVSMFQYIDTNSSRANINAINAKFEGHKVAIIGLGGTGSYILDFVAKTPVFEIQLFDGDEFLQHNAFRSPGAPTQAKLGEKLMKVDYYAEIYSNMHKGIVANAKYVTPDNISELKHMSFVFIAIDTDNARKVIIDALLEMNIPFIDVGLGVNTVDDKLIGTLRATLGTSTQSDHLAARVAMSDNDDNEYSTNIQIADLNAFNAILAIMKWKKHVGFYQDLEGEYHTTYTINVSQLINEIITA